MSEKEIGLRSPWQDEIVNWASTFSNALNQLTPGQFQSWLIGVGLHGTPQERARLGNMLLTILREAKNNE